MGIDYRVPVLHGLIDKNYVEKLKMSPSYSPESFAREYMSLWSGGSEESWFKFDRLQRYRTLKNPQTSKKSLKGADSFYLLSTDVGRYADSTICSVFKVNANQLGYSVSLVNLITLGREDKTKTFTQQAIDLKMIIDAFDPLEVVIDTNGLGVGLADEMIKEHIGPDGRILPAYGFKNDDNYKKIQPKGVDLRLYSFKANATINSQMHSNVYGRINSGSVRFLIKEQDARSALLALKKAEKMSLEQRTARLIPHEMTTLLFEEMANLRLRKSGENDKIILEQINSRFPKDRYSSFAMGLWRIKELEEEYHKKRQRKTSVKRNLVFFN